MIKPLLIRISIILLALSLAPLASCKQQSKISTTEKQNYSQEITPEVKQIIEQKTELLKSLFQNRALIHEIIKSNNETQPLSIKKMHELNRAWKMLDKHSPKVMSYSLNNCGEILKRFTARHPEFAEIFVTNINGLNFCQTNKITLFCNRHEAWWEKTFNNGKGKTYFGNIRFDKSAGQITIPIYLPIYNTQTNGVIGISNASISLEAIKAEL